MSVSNQKIKPRCWRICFSQLRGLANFYNTHLPLAVKQRLHLLILECCLPHPPSAPVEEKVSIIKLWLLQGARISIGFTEQGTDVKLDLCSLLGMLGSDTRETVEELKSITLKENVEMLMLHCFKTRLLLTMYELRQDNPGAPLRHSHEVICLLPLRNRWNLLLRILPKKYKAQQIFDSWSLPYLEEYISRRRSQVTLTFQ